MLFLPLSAVRQQALSVMEKWLTATTHAFYCRLMLLMLAALFLSLSLSSLFACTSTISTSLIHIKSLLLLLEDERGVSAIMTS